MKPCNYYFSKSFDTLTTGKMSQFSTVCAVYAIKPDLMISKKSLNATHSIKPFGKNVTVVYMDQSQYDHLRQYPSNASLSVSKALQS